MYYILYDATDFVNRVKNNSNYRNIVLTSSLGYFTKIPA